MRNNTRTASKKIHHGGHGRLVGLGDNWLPAVVITVRVNGTGDVPVTFTDEADGEQLDSVGAPLQEILTEPVKPLSGLTCRLYVAVCPAVIVADVELPFETLREKSVPVPESVTVGGLPAALSVTESVPLRLPLVAGVKVTESVQLAPAASSEVELHVCPDDTTAKSPVVAKLLIASARAPVFVRVTNWLTLVVVAS
jgi:hypothetical protein